MVIQCKSSALNRCSSVYPLNVIIASNRRSRNDDELSSWSCVSVESMALPAKTALLDHIKSNPHPNSNTQSL